MSRKVIVVYGPTASGKSVAAIELARAENGIIINADAMQCYDALHRLSAQPTEKEKGSIPHRLYGFTPPSKNLIVTDWLDFAAEEIDRALTKNMRPLLVGGTGFYLQAIMEGLSPIPDIPNNIRKNAIEKEQSEGLAALIADLQAYRKSSLDGLDLKNSRRVIRAWEVLQYTGRSLHEWQQEPRAKALDNLEFEMQFITRPRDVIIERINSRFDIMLHQNILEEVQKLSDQIDNGTVAKDNLIVKAHGFRSLRGHLKGELSLHDAAEKAKAETRQYAKRQMTWARHQFGL